MHDHDVPIAGEAQQFRELRPTSVSARGFIREDPVQNLAFKLALLVLVECADPYVPDPLTNHDRLQPLSVELSVRASGRIVKDRSVRMGMR